MNLGGTAGDVPLHNTLVLWKVFHRAGVFLLYRKVRPIKQKNTPQGCAQMRRVYCCKKHATCIWHEYFNLVLFQIQMDEVI